MGLKESLRSVGRYQWCLIVFNMFCHLPGAWVNTGILVIAPDVNFHCSDYDNNDTTQQCLIPNITDELEWNNNETYPDYTTSQNTSSLPCRNFTYDHSKFQWTLTERFNLVCDRRYYIQVAKSLYLAGFFFGALGSGMFADKFGRKRTMMFCCFLCIILSICQACVSNLAAYLVLRFVFAIFEMGMWITSLILATEFLRKDQRTLPVFTGSLSYDILIVAFAVMAMVMSNYQILHALLAGFLTLLLIVMIFFVEESPRWLYTRNKELKAQEIVGRLSEFNKTGTEHLSYLLQTCPKDSGSIRDLFRTPLIRKRTLILFVIWLVYVMAAYAISYNLGEFSDDVRISLMISGSSELLTVLPTFFIMKKFGRPAVAFGLLIVGGLLCFSMAPIVGNKSNPLLMVLAVGGMIMMDNMFLVMYLYTQELYATTIRVTGLGACSTVARIAAVLSPELIMLNEIWPPFMVVLLGCLTISVAFLVPLLPDMTNVELVQTIEENEQLFPDHTYSLKKARPADQPLPEFSWIRI